MLATNSLLLLALLLLAIFSISQGAAPKKNTVTAEQKLQQITELASSSKNNVIVLDDATYAHYVTSLPSPYSLVVFFTAAHPKFRCGVCKDLDKEFQLLASSYAKQNKQSENPVFFVKVDYESAPKTFQSYQITGVPLIFYVSPRVTDRGEKVYDISARDRYQTPPSPDAESIANFLREKTGISVSIQRSMVGAYITMAIVFSILALLVQPVINSLPFWLSIVRNKYLWLLVCLGVYTCAISGLIFDIIRSPPMYHMNPSGQIMFFYPQSGSQFVVEGFVIGFLNIASALGLVMLAHLAPRFKSQDAKIYGVLGGLLVFVFCFIQVRSLYRMKNRWYGMAM